MVFHALTFENRGFQHLLRDLATLMHWKKLFDSCVYINSTKYSLKFAKNVAVYFVTV